MAPSSDARQSIPTTSSVQQAGALPRLFNFDLPALKQSGQAFAEQADRSAIQHVLDIASGTGAWTISAAQAHPEVQFVGIERSPLLVEQAHRHTRSWPKILPKPTGSCNHSWWHQLSRLSRRSSSCISRCLLI